MIALNASIDPIGTNTGTETESNRISISKHSTCLALAKNDFEREQCVLKDAKCYFRLRAHSLILRAKLQLYTR